MCSSGIILISNLLLILIELLMPDIYIRYIYILSIFTLPHWVGRGRAYALLRPVPYLPNHAYSKLHEYRIMVVDVASVYKLNGYNEH